MDKPGNHICSDPEAGDRGGEILDLDGNSEKGAGLSAARNELPFMNGWYSFSSPKYPYHKHWNHVVPSKTSKIIRGSMDKPGDGNSEKGAGLSAARNELPFMNGWNEFDALLASGSPRG
jgi:hypothetical protein